MNTSTVSNFKLSKHARQRCAQRSFGSTDIALVLQYGTPTPEGVLMRKKDVMAAVSELRADLARLEEAALHLKEAA